jgi:hypothetical protein
MLHSISGQAFSTGSVSDLDIEHGEMASSLSNAQRENLGVARTFPVVSSLSNATASGPRQIRLFEAGAR